MMSADLSRSHGERYGEVLVPEVARLLLCDRARVIAREQSVTELARVYTMSFAAVQKHVAVLERARLVTKQRRGREQIVHADPAMLRRAARLLDAYEEIWRARAESIETILTED